MFSWAKIVCLLLSLMSQPRKNNSKFSLNGTKTAAILVICLLFLNYLTSAQQASPDSTASIALIDSTTLVNDTLNTMFRISKDKLESAVHYSSKDSIVYNAKTKMLYLHSDAEISYEDIKVNADFMRYEQDSNRLTALYIDSMHRADDSSGKSRIAQGEESSTFTSLFYNFKSRRALVENAYSKYGEGFILSEQVKRNNDNSINGFRNVYTTCDDPHPHFGIAAKKIRIIPNKVAVSGSANLVIEDIPTPLYLPFGLFPLKKGQRSGFKLPTYDMSERLGFGLREGGYYFALGEHADLLTVADIYALGSYRVSLLSSYNYRYRFDGNLSFEYATTKVGERYEVGSQNDKTFFLRWSHRINPNVMPGANFSANVNLGSSKFQRNNSYDMNAYLQNTLSSNISYSKTWAGKPFNFSAALRHNQNTSTRLVQVTLPELNFSINQIFPFQFRKEIIKPRWYEKIGASYQVSAINRIDFYDSSFSFSTLKWDDFQNGMKHSIPISANYNVLKYINTTFSANYNEYWYTKKAFKYYDFENAKLDTNLTTGFFTARDFSFNTSASTRIYGIKLFKKGLIRGIRHVLTPSVSFQYRPDFGRGVYSYYYNTFMDKNHSNRRISYFDGALYGGPPDGKVGGVGFNIGNTLQMKVRDRKDTLSGGIRKVNLIDGLSFSTFYNMAVDSFKWSNVAISYRTTLYESINLSGSMSYSPYSINKTTGTVSAITLQKAEGRLLRFERASLAIGGSLPFKKRNTPASTATNEQKLSMGNYMNYADFNIPWSLHLNYNVSLQKYYVVKSQKDTISINQDLNFSGEVNLTAKWKIGMSSGYDFIAKQLSFTSFDIYRDLHCWEMRLNLIPFGYRRSYNFSLNVKSSVLQDLKLNRRKDFRDYL